MKTITFEQALVLIDKASAVIVSDGRRRYVTYPNVTGTEGADEVALIVAPDDSGETDTCFTAVGNSGDIALDVDASEIQLADTEGNDITIILLGLLQVT